jgi:hypothetical protein
VQFNDTPRIQHSKLDVPAAPKQLPPNEANGCISGYLAVG